MPTTDEHTARAREYALGKAVEFFGSQDNGAPVMLPRTVREQARELVEASEIFYRWLCVGLRMDLLTITASAPYRPGGAATPLPEGSTMANPQVPVSYQFDLTVAPEDVLGNPVSDTLTWTNSDTTGATTLTVDDATTLKVTVAVTGVATGVEIATSDASGLTGSDTLDAVADGGTTLRLTPSAPAKTPTA